MLAACAPEFLRCPCCRTVLDDGRPCGVCTPGAPRRRQPEQPRGHWPRVRLRRTGQTGRLVALLLMGAAEVAVVRWDDGTRSTVNRRYVGPE
jgi:hypothetical protein